MKTKLITILGAVAILLTAVTNSHAQCSPAAPSLWGYNRIDGYVCQAMISAPKGLVVEYQITVRNRPAQDRAWRELKVWRVDGLVYGPVPLYKRHKYTLWARVKDGPCASQASHWNL